MRISPHALPGHRRRAALPSPYQREDGGRSIGLLPRAYRVCPVPDHNTHRPSDRSEWAPASSPGAATWPVALEWKSAIPGRSARAGAGRPQVARAFLSPALPPMRWHLLLVAGLESSHLPMFLFVLAGGMLAYPPALLSLYSGLTSLAPFQGKMEE